jgi:hypothetical protein
MPSGNGPGNGCSLSRPVGTTGHREPRAATLWIRAWAGHPNDPGIAGPSGCEHHNDLHPCAQPWPLGRPQPCWSSVVSATGGSRTCEPLLSMVLGCLDLLRLLAVCRTRSTRLTWFTDCRGWRAVVLGNNPISVRWTMEPLTTLRSATSFSKTATMQESGKQQADCTGSRL